jgi:hypothetical protein
VSDADQKSRDDFSSAVDDLDQRIDEVAARDTAPLQRKALKWEYRVLHTDGNREAQYFVEAEKGSDMRKQELSAALAEMGDAGWELAGVLPNGGVTSSGGALYFKRPKG